MDKSAYEFIKESQRKHWWFIGRSHVVRRFFSNGSDERKTTCILDIGSGFGALIPVLRKIGKVDVLEPYKDAHKMLKELNVNTIFSYNDFPETYPKKRYNVVSLFDVIEHIEDDQNTIGVIYHKLLKENGKILLTVPAYQWLWTKHDDSHHHKRRYTAKQIKFLLKNAGFKNIRVSYFMFLLFPLALLSRLLAKWRYNEESQLKMPNIIVNSCLKKIFCFESLFIKKLNFPFGLSIIATGEK